MRTPSLARGLACLAVLLAPLIVSSARAAPARHKKPAHSAPVTSASAAAPDVAANENAQPKPGEDAQPKPSEDAQPKPSEATPEPATRAPEPAPDVETPSAVDGEPNAVQAEQALGKREAARLAAGRTEVSVWGSLDIGTRHFKYSDPVGRLLAPYSLPAAPMASIGLEAYPLASTGLPVLADLGFRGRLSRAVGAGSTTPDGVAINTSWTRFNGELRERLLIAGSHPAELGLYIGGDANYFDMSTKSKVAAYPPRARSIAVRFGIDARVLLTGRFSTLLGISYLDVVEAGEIYDRFRDPNVHGMDADLGFALGLLPGLEARLTGRYTRYFSTFKPQLGDPAVAGGALDQLLQFGLGARYAH